MKYKYIYLEPFNIMIHCTCFFCDVTVTGFQLLKTIVADIVVENEQISLTTYSAPCGQGFVYTKNDWALWRGIYNLGGMNSLYEYLTNFKNL